MDTKKLFKHIPWVILGIIGAFCLAVVALRRGEHVSALWIVVASVSVYLVAYRYYSLYIAQKVMKLDPTRATPAVINNDGLNYVPTNRYVLFGHHFAAIMRCWSAGWSGSRRADGLPTWHAVAAGGGSTGRCGTGLYGAVYLLSP